MKILPVIQGSDEWLGLRALYITASELDCLITPAKLQPKTGLERNSYVCRKIAERWLGRPEESPAGWAADQGTILEEEAIPWYELTYGVTLDRPGFFVNDAETFGCSPDGWNAAEQTGVEIKCPQPENHVKWVLAGACPREHFLQVQGSMFATVAPTWDFMSYARGFPELAIEVGRDEALMRTIEEVVGEANAAIDKGLNRLIELNDGPPRRRIVKPPPVLDDDPFAALPGEGL